MILEKLTSGIVIFIICILIVLIHFLTFKCWKSPSSKLRSNLAGGCGYATKRFFIENKFIFILKILKNPDFIMLVYHIIYIEK